MEQRLSTSRDRRRNAIIATAREVFLRSGYAGTTMSAIAAKIGGSKTTLWSYFGSKELLFAAVLDEMVERYGEALRVPLALDDDPADVLRRFGNSMMRTITTPEVISLHRLVIAESDRSPHLGRMLWARGGDHAERRLAAWLAHRMAGKGLRQCDPLVAARHFAGLCQAGHYYRNLVGAIGQPEPCVLEQDVDRAVDVFLAAYRA